MPFTSKKQMKWMFANKPRMAKRWAEHTPDISSLPEQSEAAGTPKDSKEKEATSLGTRLAQSLSVSAGEKNSATGQGKYRQPVFTGHIKKAASPGSPGAYTMYNAGLVNILTPAIDEVANTRRNHLATYLTDMYSAGPISELFMRRKRRLAATRATSTPLAAASYVPLVGRSLAALFGTDSRQQRATEMYKNSPAYDIESAQLKADEAAAKKDPKSRIKRDPSIPDRSEDPVARQWAAELRYADTMSALNQALAKHHPTQYRINPLLADVGPMMLRATELHKQRSTRSALSDAAQGMATFDPEGSAGGAGSMLASMPVSGSTRHQARQLLSKQSVPEKTDKKPAKKEKAASHTIGSLLAQALSK